MIPNDYLATLIAEEHMQDRRREAEIHKQLRQAGHLQRFSIFHQVRSLISRVGRFLVGLGKRLEDRRRPRLKEVVQAESHPFKDVARGEKA